MIKGMTPNQRDRERWGRGMSKRATDHTQRFPVSGRSNLDKGNV